MQVMAVAVSNHYQRVRYENARRQHKEQQLQQQQQQQAAPHTAYTQGSRTASVLDTSTGTVPMLLVPGAPAAGQRQLPWPPHFAVSQPAAGTAWHMHMHDSV